MKNNQLLTLFVALLFFSTLASAALMYKYNASVRTIQKLAPEFAGATTSQNIMQSLLNETIEYGNVTKNQDIAKIISSVTAKNTPAAKPAK